MSDTIKATRKARTAPAPVSAPATPAPAPAKSKGGPAWDNNFTDADRALCRLAMDAAAGIDAAERNAAKAFQRCYSANLHGKAGFSDFARWAAMAGDAYGLPEKAKASIYRLVNAGVALDCGAQAGEDLSDVPSHTLAGIIGNARKTASAPEAVPSLVRMRAGEYRKARAGGMRSEDAHAVACGKPARAEKSAPGNADARCKAIVSAVLRVSDSWAERVTALESALDEVKRLRAAANG